MNKIPFILGDLILLALASWIIVDHGGLPDGSRLILVVVCILCGVIFSVLPFLFDHRADLKREEWDGMASVGEQMQHLPGLEQQIHQATGRWQGIQEECQKAVSEAAKVTQSLREESVRILEVMQSIDVAEKDHMRVELEKLKRGEGDWLQASVRVLDHVFALHRAARQSGQPKLIEQITHFQHAVLDVMRRVGLGLHEAEPKAPYDEAKHQVLEQKVDDFKEPMVAGTLAPGVSYQGRGVRLPLVRLVEASEYVPPSSAESSPSATPGSENAPETSAEMSEDDSGEDLFGAS